MLPIDSGAAKPKSTAVDDASIPSVLGFAVASDETADVEKLERALIDWDI